MANEIFRGPVFVYTRTKQGAKPESDVNLQPLQNYVPPVKPFHEDVWVNPWRQSPRSTAESFSSSRTLISPNPANPFSQTDWENPNKKPEKIESQSFGSKIWLIQPIIRQSNWDNPKQSRRPAKVDEFVNLSTLFNPNPNRPFQLSEWPSLQPKRPPSRAESYDSPDTLLNPGRPFNQNDWLRVGSVRHTSKSDLFQNLLPLRGQPFRQTDWGNPNSALKQTKFEDFTRNLLTFQSQPFRQELWDLPHSNTHKSPEFSLNSNLFVVEVQKPFSFSEWDNPTTRKLNQLNTEYYSSFIKETPVPPVVTEFKQTYFVANVGRMMNR